jgi:hypothetical protein
MVLTNALTLIDGAAAMKGNRNQTALNADELVKSAAAE